MAPSGSMMGSPGFSGRPARVLLRCDPGMTFVLPYPGSARSVRAKQIFVMNIGRGSMSISEFCRYPSWCQFQNGGSSLDVYKRQG